MYSKQMAAILLMALILTGCNSGASVEPIEEDSGVEAVSSTPKPEPTEEQLHPSKFYAIEPSDLTATAAGNIKFVSKINTFELAFSPNLVPFKQLPDRSNAFPELYLFRPLAVERLHDGTEVPANIAVYNFLNEKGLSVKDWLVANADRFDYKDQELVAFQSGVRYQTSGFGNNDIVVFAHNGRIVLLNLHYYGAPEAPDSQEWVAYFKEVVDSIVLKN
jgi:hypothetical protein